MLTPAFKTTFSCVLLGACAAWVGPKGPTFIRFAAAFPTASTISGPIP